MPRELKISVGQYSDKGRKETNQDFYGVLIPEEPLLSLKGIAVVLADGISSSAVSRIASESAVKGFLTDYYCTSESWSVKTSAQRVLAATNSWLHSQTRRSQFPYEKDKGYVCTLSAMVIKSTSAHIFHVGDARVYRVDRHGLEQLTNDHRVIVSSEQSYLGRALGVNPQIEIDYQMLQVDKGDVFLLATDGVYEHVSARSIAKAVNDNAEDLDKAARMIVYEAYQQGSPDNLTVQIVRIEDLPEGEASEVFGHVSELPLPPLLEARMLFDGYRIVRELHGSSRSHIYLAVDTESDDLVAIKLPSIDLRNDPAYLRRFMMEEWVARRINSAHVLKPCAQSRRRNYLYVVMEFIDGQTLAQWMIDNPKPDLETIRGIAEQIAKGLRAFHRKEMLHQDISADLFSLGVITYQMLTGRLPYGAEMAKVRTKSQQRQLRYDSVLDDNREIPAWIDGVLKRAVHPDPFKRYEALSEFTHDLRQPNERYVAPTALIERNPLLFWKSVTVMLALMVIWLLASLHGARH